MKFNLASAQMAARNGEIEAWVQAYLQSGEWANPGLSSGLNLQPRWWRGPLELPLSSLQRACGPEQGMEYRMDAEAWVERTTRLATSFTTLESIPPLIAEYRLGVLSIRDGNHRLEAIRLKGWLTAWVIIWYNSIEDYQADSCSAPHPIP